MIGTKNDLPEKTRKQLVELLNSRLADSLDLQVQCKQAHWNVKGPQFIALHKLFDEVAAGVAGYTDELAERVVQLGGLAKGTLQTAVAQTSLPEYPLEITQGPQHVDALSTALAAFGKLARQAIDKATELGDADTADLFTEVSRGTDKWLWFVEAHQQHEGR